MPFEIDPIEIRQCGHLYGEHRCVLYNCPRDDPDHVHVCFADDFDWKEGDHTLFRLGKMTEQEFWFRCRVLYGERRSAGIHRAVAVYRSEQAVLKAVTTWREQA